jgi:Predicted ATPase (AAA+ superfamily)
LVVTGGWPGQFRLSSLKNSALLAKQYIEATINDDMNRLEDKKRDIEKMKRLVKSLARNESTTASIKTLKRDMENADGRGMDEDTIADYIEVLKRMFMIDDQPPFATSVRSTLRIKQAWKRHFTDPSIACSLLNLTQQSLIADLNTFGFLFEALCERDLRIYAESIDAKLYHYQDYQNREIDAVVQYNDGRWGAFEIKLGANQIDEASKGLLRIKQAFVKDGNVVPPSFLCVICGTANAVCTRADGVIVVPITALKN